MQITNGAKYQTSTLYSGHAKMATVLALHGSSMTYILRNFLGQSNVSALSSQDVLRITDLNFGT